MNLNLVLVVYALLLILGGVFGFKKGSMVSLVAGIGSGSLVLLSAWLVSINPKGGWFFFAALNGALAAVFFIRLMKTQQFMPSGMLLGFALVALILGVCQWLRYAKS